MFISEIAVYSFFVCFHGVCDAAIKPAARNNFKRCSPSLAALLQQLWDQRCPPGLMRCAQPRAIVRMEILGKRNVVAEIGVVLKPFRTAKHRTPPIGIA